MVPCSLQIERHGGRPPAGAWIAVRCHIRSGRRRVPSCGALIGAHRPSDRTPWRPATHWRTAERQRERATAQTEGAVLCADDGDGRCLKGAPSIYCRPISPSWRTCRLSARRRVDLPPHTVARVWTVPSTPWAAKARPILSRWLGYT